MTFMDRTVEFNTVAENMRSKQITSKPVRKAAKQQRSQFSQSASKIGKEIYDTSDKLSKLTKLAKLNDLFEDHTVEIEELTFIIKQNIQNLNKEIAVLRESSRASNQSKQNTVHSDTIVSFLNSKLASTTKGFKDILQVRTETLKTKQDKINKITGGSLMSTPAKKQSEHVLYKHHLDSLPDTPPRSGGDVVVLMPQMMMQQQQEDYTTSRASAVENIERTIVELGGIFQQLAALVAEQGDMIQRIDSNIDNSERHVSAGNDALLRVLKNVSSSRMLIMKLFLVLIVFAVIFIVFFV